MSNFTENQSLAIKKDGTNIIVSAGAGSGKTTVLTARVIRKIEEGVDINKLLILTFTNEAAFNMKKKIREELTKKDLKEALDYLDQAYITTFDSYALSMVKKYHYLLNVSKNISIIDSSIMDNQRKAIIDDIFDNMYGNDKFNSFIDKFTVKDDKDIKSAILSMNKLLDLRYDKDEYLKDYINNYYNDNYINQLIDKYINFIILKKNNIAELIDNISNIDGNYGSKLYELYKPIIDSNTFEDIKNIYNISLPAKPRGSDEVLTKAKDNLSRLIDEIKDLTLYDIDYYKNSLLSTKENVEVIIDIINELDKKILAYKKEFDVYEFTDIAKMAIKVVKDNQEVRNELKNYYNEIMVDEYQDTSDLQETFINEIENNNVYMVGDIKQSIYRFRNANPSIFRNKYNEYSKNNGGYKIDLLENFRSREEVLKNINEIFDYIMDDRIGNAAYKDTHRMIYGNKSFELKGNQDYNLKILNYNNDKEFKSEEIEAFIVANDIKNKIENHYQILDNGLLRDFTYSDACIIMDRDSAFTTYKKVFEYLGIPLVMYHDETLNDEKDIYVIRNLINLIIKIYKKEYDKEFKYYFTSIARSYLFEYTDEYIFDIFDNNSFKDSTIYQLANDISNDLINMTNFEFINRIIKDFNIYENTIKIGDINKSIVRINYLINLAKSLSNLGYTPIDFMQYLNDNIDTDIKYSINNKMGNNVKIMNIHKSKGLEFNICYFTGLYKEFNLSDFKSYFIYSNTYGIISPYYNNGIGDTILKSMYKNEYMLEEISEKIRLLYVGLTRTKEHMIVIAPISDEENDFGSMVSDEERLSYKSFLDIINSVKSKLLNYITDIDYHKTGITKKYNTIKDINYNSYINKTDDKIEFKNINIDTNEISISHFSKENNKLYTKEEIENMEYGTYIHYLFQITDFNNPIVEPKYKELIINFINQLNLNNCNIYKEYEFTYKDEMEEKHGIIDLMLEYEDHIDIYDYKLKNTLDDAYKKQLEGYKKYIENITNKPVYTYLYSILEKNIKNIN